MNRKYIFSGIILFFGVVSFVLGTRLNSPDDPEQVVGMLENAILKAKKNGDYKCCISPACKMCYLGNWKFEKGKCFCDDAILEGRNENVCPECKKGLKEGICSSV
ncbi:hypothetical protein GF327_09195 [Candidatus Woesearchaeota archaeon]|nr:hypothetical protein [Candidatus Woesearchaeota archaeon]